MRFNVQFERNLLNDNHSFRTLEEFVGLVGRPDYNAWFTGFDLNALTRVEHSDSLGGVKTEAEERFLFDCCGRHSISVFVFIEFLIKKHGITFIDQGLFLLCEYVNHQPT